MVCTLYCGFCTLLTQRQRAAFVFCVHNLCLTADTHKYHLMSESSFSCQNEKITSWALFRTLWLITPVRETGCQYITPRAPSPDLKLGPPHTSVCVRENVVYDLWEGSKDHWECMWVMVGPSGSWCVSVCVQVQMSYGRVQWPLWWRGRPNLWLCQVHNFDLDTEQTPNERERERDWHPFRYSLSVCVLCVIYFLIWQNGDKMSNILYIEY